MAITPVMRTWIGGGNNQAGNAKDWSPTGVPQPGDTLMMSPGTTLNVQGNDLAGNQLALSNSDTLDLSKGATVDVLAGNQVSHTSNVINISGTDTLKYQTLGEADTDVTVNLAANSQWVGGFAFDASNVVVNGGPHASFANQQSELSRGSAVINVDVVGTGAFEGDRGTLEFGKSVSAGQSCFIAVRLRLDDPTHFLGAVTLEQGSSDAQVDLIGLATADSYTYQSDLLSIFSRNKVIDTLRLTNDKPNPIVVEKTSVGVSVVTSYDPTNPPVGLPIHVGS